MPFQLQILRDSWERICDGIVTELCNIENELLDELNLGSKRITSSRVSIKIATAIQRKRDVEKPLANDQLM